MSPDPTNRDELETLRRNRDALANSLAALIEKTDTIGAVVTGLLAERDALRARVDQLERTVTAITNTTRGIYGRLDRVETELQIDERPNP